MPDTSPVEELISRWQSLREQGQAPSVEVLCAECPELIEECKDRLRALAAMEKFLSAGDQASPASVSAFDEIDFLCRAFGQEWRQLVALAAAALPAGPGTVDFQPIARPDLAGYLARVAEDARSTLLRNLLPIEIEQCRAAGEQPLLDEYLERFPQFAAVIRHSFLQHASASTAISSTDRGPLRAPAASQLGEYRLLGELGRGGMGVVFEAMHVQRGHRVALKTLPAVDGNTLHRFKREFRALADINHPNLIGLHTLEADGCHWFFTMDLLNGVDFLRYVRPGNVLDETRLRAALSQLVTGVMALHGQHIIHRDLKPSNVMVTEEGRIVLLDFGLVAELDKGGQAGGETIAGTPKYMAPEQAAGRMVTAATDWYAVGVMVYEALCGRPPFSGSLLRVVQDKQRLEPPPLPSDGAIPEDLARLCMRLVAREAAQRPDAFEIVKAVAGSAGTSPAAHSGQYLVGREPHLAALQDAYQTFERHSQPLTVFISGRSGEGKTTLAEHFLTKLRAHQRLVVMAGRCYDRESVPFKALDSLIDALCSYLRSLPGEDAALMMPDDIGVLIQVFPVLQGVEVVAKAAPVRLAELDQQQIRQRAFGALRALLKRLGRRAPLVWFIDDLQWGDADSAEALFEVLRPPEAPPLLFLGAYRRDETEGSTFLQMWQELQRKHAVQFADRDVRVGPLTVEECTELVIGLLGEDNEVVRRRAAEFAAETRGNPFLLIELVGCFDADTGSFEPMPLHEALTRKLGRLPAEAGQLLEVVAISGQALALDEAWRTAGHELPPVATITRMRNERLLRLIGPEDNWVPRNVLAVMYELMRETVIQCWHSLWPWGLHRQAPGGRRDLTIRFFGRLVNSYAFQSTPKVCWAHLAGMNRAELLPPSPELAVIYGHHACLLSMILGWRTRQVCYAERAARLGNTFNDLLVRAHCANYQGISYCASAHYEEALTHLNESAEAFAKAGDHWQLNLAHFHKARCHYGLGNLTEAIAEARWTFASSARLGDSRTLCSSYVWVRAARGNVAFEELRSCLPCRPDDIMSTVHGVMAEGYWHSFHGCTGEALQAFERAAQLVRKSLCLNFHTAAAFPALAGALRLHAETVRQRDPDLSAQLRRRAYRTAKWATRITALFPTAYPQALRERSLILAAYGKTQKALRFADKSCVVAEAQKARYEHAQSLLVRGKLAKELGLPEAEEQIRTAEAALEAIERPVREAPAQPMALTPASQVASDSQTPVAPAKSTAPARRTSLGRRYARAFVGIGLLIAGGLALGQLLGSCAGYVADFATGVIGLPSTETGAAASVGAAVGRVVFPCVLLLGWVLVLWAQRHHAAAFVENVKEKASPPPALFRCGMLLLAICGFGLWMVPVALGIWLGGLCAGVLGGGLGGALGLALPVIFWRRTR